MNDAIKYADLLGEWLVDLGYTHCFMLAGGGCMHLIDGFRSRFNCIPVVHEVAAGIAAEHFNECSTKGKAFALVTTGPGLTNIITAIAGAYSERRELLVIAGQVKSTDLLQAPLRQRGIQEVDGVAICESITTSCTRLTSAISKDKFIEIVSHSIQPHPGPVLIEVCLDVQGALVNRSLLESKPNTSALLNSEVEALQKNSLNQAVTTVASALREARRPIILFGGLIKRDTVWNSLESLVQSGIPVMTTTSAIDRIPSDSPVNAGRPGTWGGQRCANMLIAQADLVIAIGAQLDLQQTGFNWKEFIPSGKVYQIYPCKAELGKGHPELNGAYEINPDSFFNQLVPCLQWQDKDAWLEYVQKTIALLPTLEPSNTVKEGYLSSFSLLRNISIASEPDDILALCSSGGTFTGALQCYHVGKRQYATSSPAFASMGYGLATAIGASFAQPNKRVILTEGDGGFAQNLQELALIRRHNLPIKIFLIDNGGYASIRATQKKFFNGAYVGCDELTGLGFPNWTTLFHAYGIPAKELEPNETSPEELVKLLNRQGPEAWIVKVDPDQANWPAVSSKILPDGKMASNPLYNMLPPLPQEIAKQVSRYLPNQ